MQPASMAPEAPSQTSTHPPRRGSVWCIALLVLLASGCSVVGMLYERIDLLMGLEADSWLDLDADQRRHFRRAVRERMEQNRIEELPEYIAFLELAAMRVERSPDSATLLADAESLRLLLRDTLGRSLPLIAGTLAGLRPAQIDHLEERFEERNADYAREYLEIPPDRFRANRLRRSREAVERWTGRLDAGQRAELAALVDEIPDGSDAWNAYSLAWQQALMDQLRAGADREQLLALLTHWWTTDAAMDPAYVATLENNRRLIAEALARLLPTLSARQRSHAAREFRALARDLREVRQRKLEQS